jgi:DNA-binding NarL/FixJ family response regulator
MSTTGKRILCIEDDQETGTLIAEDLEERGYTVTVELNGQGGLEAILKTAPDLVLCDIDMPGMTGFEVLESLTSIAPQIEPTPFVFLTALSDRENEMKGRRLGADDYVIKPIDFERLASIIEVRLRQGPRHQVGAQQIDLNERELACLTWSARGKTSVEIAAILGVAKRTVDFHIENASRKLHVTTRTQAVVKAIGARLINP